MVQQRRYFSLVIFLLVISLSPLFGGGQEEEIKPNSPELTALREEVEELIGLGYLDQALILLIEFSRANPNTLKLSHEYIRIINEFKIEYSQLYDQLIDALYREDFEESQRLINALEELDADPNRPTRNYLSLARLVAEKNLNNILLARIFQESNEKLEAQQYQEAVDSYRKGFSLYRQIFLDFLILSQDSDTEGGDTIPFAFQSDPERWELVKEVYSAWGPLVRDYIRDLELDLDNWQESYRASQDVVNSGLASLETKNQEEWSVHLADILGVLNQEKAFLETLKERQQQVLAYWNEMLLQLEGIPEDFWLNFVDVLLKGRENEPGPEGILASLQLYGTQGYTAILAQLESRIQEGLAQGKTDFLQNLWDDASLTYQSLSSIFETFQDVMVEAEYYSVLEAEIGEEELSRVLFNLEAYSQAFQETLPLREDLLAWGQNLPSLPQDVDGDRMDAVEESISRLNEQLALLQEIGEEFEFSRSANAADATPQMTAVQNDLAEELLHLQTSYGQTLLSFMDSAARFNYEGFLASVSGLGAWVEAQAEVYLDEDAESLSSGSLPQRRSSFFLGEIVQPSQDTLDETEEAMGNQGGILAIEGLVEDNAYFERNQALLKTIQEERRAIDPYETLAAGYVRAAQRAQGEAENDLALAESYYQEAIELIAAGENDAGLVSFDSALSALDKVSIEYLNIYENDIDIAQASGIDEARDELSARISASRQNVSVQVARSAINNARILYNEGNYIEGLTLVVRAKEFWEKARGEPNQELDRLETLLQNAEEALSQSVIGVEDPLYIEMTQYMNLAVKYYNEGRRIKLQSGRAADYTVAFSTAEGFIEQVEKVFPRNNLALTMKQKVFKEQFPEEFAREAQTLMSSTQRSINRGDTDTAWEQLPELKALKEVSPDQPGLDELIKDVEIFLGLRPPPVNVANLNRSDALTKEAQELWDQAVAQGRESFVADRVKELVFQALDLNPDNTAAAVLKDDIARDVGGRVVVVLTIEDQALFRRAQEFYSQASYPQAWALIRKLLDANSQNAQYAPLKDLERRVEARL